MDQFKKEAEVVASTILNNVGVRSALSDALSNPGDFSVAFRAAWVIAKSFFYLGDNLSELEMVAKAARTFLIDPEDRHGCKMAYIDREGRQAIIVVTRQGAIQIANNQDIILRGSYGKVSSKLRERLSEIICLLLLQGMPLMGLCDILDAFHSEDDELEKHLVKLHIVLGWEAV